MILFSADWHLKLNQKNVPKEWALRRYASFFEQVNSIEADLHIIGGDLFDRLPNMEELELYFRFVKNAQIPTLIYDGNHEATKKGATFFSQLREVTLAISNRVNIVTKTDLNYANLNFGVLPYCELHKEGSIERFDHSKPLFTHVRGEIPPHVKPEVDLDRFNKFPVVFAGDLHAHSNTQRNIVYPGSPMTTSFHRNEVETGYILIDESDGSWEWKPFKLPQLLRKTVSSPDQMVATDYHHTIYELEGDLKDLALTKNTELLDKKIIKRSSDTSLILDKDMTVEQELIEYLTYILELDSDKCKNIVSVYKEFSKS
jgi:DNA repair exonuclease SbcCD nuclease subunit